jgi:hypothetical protein
MREHGTNERPGQEAKHLKSWASFSFLKSDNGFEKLLGSLIKIPTRVVKNTTMIVLVMMVA